MTPTNSTWYSLTYTPAAPPGLPPVIQADQVMKYRDDNGTWLVALWQAPTHGAPANCILRVPGDQVTSVRAHQSLAEAAAGMAHD